MYNLRVKFDFGLSLLILATQIIQENNITIPTIPE